MALARGRGRAITRQRVPKPLIPTPVASFLVIGIVAFVASIGNFSFQSPSISLPTTFSFVSLSPQAALVVSGQAESLTVNLSNVLPFSRDFQLVSTESGPLDTPQAQARWSNPSGSQYQGWGRTEGYQTTYRRTGLSENLNAPVEIYSRVDLFRDANGAQQAFKEESQQRKQGPTTALSAMSFGDATVAYSATNGAFTQYLVLFQKGTSLAQLLVTGYTGRISPDAAFALANQMSTRMEVLSGAP